MAGIFDPGIFDSGIFDDAGATARTTTDAPTTSDAVTRALVASRAVTAAPTTSDVATRAQVLSRTATEAISAADVATFTTGAIARAATDAPTTSDSATRALTASRAVADAPTIAGTVTRSAALTRTTSDALTTNDTARSTFIRSATEAISTADVATRVRNVGRSTTEAVSATVAATRAVVLSRNVTQALTGADVALSVPVPYLPGPVIYIDGVNITKADGDPVIFSTARFMSAVNGVAGEAHFRVRDDLGTSTYVPGQPLSLVIDGQATWTGFITNVKRVYAFPALNVDDFGPTRFFDIDGTDLNILFSRRIVFNTAHPENVLAPLYSFYTPDVTAISDLLAGWLDLTGDALDTSTDVHHVGAINADQLGRAWEGSDTWGQAMQSITALPASIYYIRPNRLFAYVDTDTPDAPFGLSDVPNGTTSKGYREMEVLFDGTSLANDVLAWGVGYGSTSPVFTRAEDATSQSEHGLWQVGQTAFGIYKQATIDRVADSILNGSPDHHRGAKDDRHAVTITTYEPGLLPAQKLLFESNVFGYSEVLPIRKMEITFPTPTTPKYELTLSQEIDVPWSFFDVFRIPGFGFKLPGFTVPPFPPLVTPGGCADCGITDSFARTISGSLGSSDIGVPWQMSGSDGWSVDGTQAIAVTTPAADQIAELDITATNASIGLDVLSTDEPPGDGDSSVRFGINSATDFLFVRLFSDSDNFASLHSNHHSSGDVMSVGPWTGPVHVRLMTDGSTGYFRIWSGSTEPSTWDLTVPMTGGSSGVPLLYVQTDTNAPVTSFSLGVTDLDVAGVDRCTFSPTVYDSFNRLVSSGAGTGDQGEVWTNVTTPSGSDYGVNGSQYFCGMSGGTFRVRTATGPWTDDDTVTMETRFSFLLNTGISYANIPGFRMFMQDNASPSNHLLGWVVNFNLGVDQFEVFSGNSNVGVYTVPAAWATFNYHEPVWFRVKWTFAIDTGVIQGKIWLDNEAEPANFQCEVPLTSAAGLTTAPYRFNVEVSSAVIDRAEYIDWINISSPINACNDGACGITDFGTNRNVSGDWGTADSGLVWQQFDHGSPGTTPGVAYDVVAGKGVMTVTDTSIEAGSIETLLPVDEFTVEFIVSDYTTTDYLGYFSMTQPAYTSFNYVSLNALGHLIGLTDNAFSSATFDFNGDPFHVKVERTAAGTNLKWWYSAAVEPAEWLLSQTVGARSGASALSFESDAANNNGTTWSISELTVTELPTTFLAGSQLWSQFTGDRTRRASSLGGVPSIIDGPNFNAGNSTAGWSGEFNGLNNFGTDEIEFRVWSTWLLPPGSTYVTLAGVIRSALLAGDVLFAGPAQDFISPFTLYSGTWDPDTGPTDFDSLGSAIVSGTLAGTTAQLNSVNFYGDPSSITITSSAMGATYDPGDHRAWVLFQAVLVLSGSTGLGRQQWLSAPGHGDGVFQLAPYDRFPLNPNWVYPGHGAYDDFSQVQNGAHLAISDDNVAAYSGSPVVLNCCTLGNCSPGVLPSAGGSMFSPQCEVAVRVDSTHYQLTFAVASGTETVYEGTPGLLLLPGIARDYTIDIAAGLITLAVAVTADTRIYVCYTGAGPVS